MCLKPAVGIVEGIIVSNLEDNCQKFVRNCVTLKTKYIV